MSEYSATHTQGWLEMESSAEQAAKEQKAKEQAILEFLKRDYELRINYLSAHFTRMWTRFNFFIALESAISIALFNSFNKETGNYASTAILIALVGVVSSLCWYAFGAQDRYLVEAYRTQVKNAGTYIAEKVGIPDYIYVGNPSTGKTQQWYEYFYQWRFEPFSTTKLAAWFPLLVFIYWIGVLVWILQ